MTTLLPAVVDLVLPRRCVGCGAPGLALCRRCLPGAPVDVPDDPVPGLPVLAGGHYAGALRRAVIAFKERGRRDLVGPLGLLLGQAVQVLLAPTGGRAGAGAVLVPVPSSAAAAALRGGDHVLRLARRGAVVSGVRVAPGVLRLERAVHDSAGLDRGARERNLHGALGARAPVDARGRVRRAIVVDDIVTTGATLREAVRALRREGWVVPGCAVVATTPRTRAGPDDGDCASRFGYPLAAPSPPV